MPKRVMKKTSSPLKQAIKVVYIIVVILSALIVAGFAAYTVLVRAPDVDEQVTFPAATPSPSGQVQASPSPAPGGREDPEPSPSEEALVFTRREGVYTCLLLGVADYGGADSIMLGMFDTNSRTASLISIPRDTLVLRNGKNGKLNALYSSGGAEAMTSAVSDMLGVPVDYYVSVNFKAFQAIVKTIGGVYFDVPIDMDYDDPDQDLHIHLKKGYQKLDAKQAMWVVRFRHNNDGSGYPDQDLGRVRTQRAFLAAVVKQTITVSNITKVTELINTLSKHVKTDMPLDTMIFFATNAIGMDLDSDLSSATLPGKWKSPYQEVDDEAALEMINELLPVYNEPVVKEITNFRHR